MSLDDLIARVPKDKRAPGCREYDEAVLTWLESEYDDLAESYKCLTDSIRALRFALTSDAPTKLESVRKTFGEAVRANVWAMTLSLNVACIMTAVGEAHSRAAAEGSNGGSGRDHGRNGKGGLNGSA